jgi:hypothetical protein
MSDDSPSPSGLTYLRNVTKSLTGGLPYSEEIEDKLARVLSGLASQAYTRDPKTGELYLAGIQRMKDIVSGTPQDQRKGGLPGLVNETLSVPELMALVPGGAEKVPDWAIKAAENADATHQAVRQEAGLSEPKGFMQNAAEGAGVMLGQLPLPLARLRALKAVAPAVESGPRLAMAAKKVLGSAPEWFSPTVEPSVANYAAGAGFGGGIGAYSDYLDDKAKQDLEDASARNSDAALARHFVQTGSTGYAEGGKIGALHRALQGLVMGPRARVGAHPAPQSPIDRLRDTVVHSLPPEDASHFDDWIQSIRNQPELSDEDVSRLIDLHDRIMKPPPPQE